MEEPLPQDDDPNFSALNPMGSPLLSRDLIFEGLFFKNWGWARGAALTLEPEKSLPWAWQEVWKTGDRSKLILNGPT